jgi:hypothetical protein
MPSYVDDQYGKLDERRARVTAFFGDLDANLASIGATTIYHLDIYWDGGFVRVTETGAKLAVEPADEQLKYYNQGLGLMKLAINDRIY